MNTYYMAMGTFDPFIVIAMTAIQVSSGVDASEVRRFRDSWFEFEQVDERLVSFMVHCDSHMSSDYFDSCRTENLVQEVRLAFDKDYIVFTYKVPAEFHSWYDSTRERVISDGYKTPPRRFQAICSMFEQD